MRNRLMMIVSVLVAVEAAASFGLFSPSAAPGTGSYTWMDRIWEFMNAQGVNK